MYGIAVELCQIGQKKKMLGGCLRWEQKVLRTGL